MVGPAAGVQRRSLPWAWLVVGLVILAAGFVLWPRLLPLISQQNAAVDPEGLPLHVVERRDMLITVTEEGSLVSDDNVDITCDVAGGATIIELVDDGARVTKGMEIVKLDDSVISENATARFCFFKNFTIGLNASSRCCSRYSRTRSSPVCNCFFVGFLDSP